MMKISLFNKICIIIFFTFSCCVENVNTKVESDNNINSITNNMMFPITKINSNFEQFDIDWLKETATEKYPMGSDFQYYYKEVKDSVSIFISGNNKSGYHFVQFDNNGFFAMVKNYYKNGNIKDKGVIFNTLSETSGFKKGIWYEFDEQGKLMDTTDYDEYFDYKAEDVFRFCEKEQIMLEKGDKPYFGSGFHTQIRRFYPKTAGTCKWIIIRSKGGIQIEEIILDGKTGKVLSRKDLTIVDG